MAIAIDNTAIETLELTQDKLISTCLNLRDDPKHHYEQLTDLCGVDYSEYGKSAWDTNNVANTGFSRGVTDSEQKINSKNTDLKSRFAVVYHLLSFTNKKRLRLKVFLDEQSLQVPSVVSIWPAANWFEREAFDLFGIFFTDHPDLRRILTDYGFIGHPFRKDFPLIGNVEMRYDATLGRVIYEPTSIESRTLVPKTIRGKDEVI